MGKFIDMTGWVMAEHGVPDSKLTIINRAQDKLDSNGYRIIRWNCLCSCGNTCVSYGKEIRSGATKSCGCIQREKASQLDETLREYDKEKNIVAKVCCKCKRMLSIDNFNKNSSTADGYHGTCKYCNTHSPEGRYNIYKKGAKSRNLDFLLSQAEFNEITEKPCHYCGEYEKEYFGTSYSGIDRINSVDGYNLNNVVPCCETCNRMKLDYNTDNWIRKMKQIIIHMGVDI